MKEPKMNRLKRCAAITALVTFSLLAGTAIATTVCPKAPSCPSGMKLSCTKMDGCNYCECVNDQRTMPEP